MQRTPVIDDSGATFTWRGRATSVAVVGSWCGWQLESALPLHRTGDAWRGHLALARDAYVEYNLVVDGKRVPDPGNPHRVSNGFEGRNQQLWMPDASHRAEALRSWRGPRGEVRRGQVTLGWRSAAPRRRRLDLYLPPSAVDSRDLPLLIVLDGPDYLDRGRLNRVLDGLIGSGSMAPLAAAFVANAGPSRAVEYAANDLTLATLADELVPEVIDRLGLAPQAASDGGAGRAAILGSSMGGLMALHAGLRRSDVFGRAVCQSVAVFEAIGLTTIELIRHVQPPPVRLWQDAGDHEWLAEPNDRLAELLRARGYDATYRRHHGGHDQTSWVESLVDALPAMFPPSPPRSG